ncbi:SLC13 family permease [Ignatzschineria cameli]|uniref:SLC13 family permease n=1 Tax=Ignatzschineria cameli TaxID=2182793 RepID=A0A2U2ASX9_9GAMM|nr:SLC13 family permease [Ignatzschineria cameli]PWD85947.1 SLC13 family permease [Ignatzschineria cameli]PWD87844.1 SLC13 family permease [Ignatzschineria cameli]PWD90412.1 SLC13 family permease [Ignatzschineria cameli]PWD92296.1 SLC13 family permease [Ignatzschineria cameli]PWD93089.1 SLC13 family permease [Ignatzschineria cameli]
MNQELLIVLALLFIAIVAFMINKPRMDVVAVCALLALPLTGSVTLDQALAGFSDSSVIIVAVFFIIGDGLVRTGVAFRVGDWLMKQSKNSETRLIVLLMLSVALLGSVMSSTGIVAIFIPIVLSVAAKMKADTRRLMMPLSFAGLISGMLTLVATAPNLVVSAQLELAGNKAFEFFSFTPIGLIILVVGIFYMLFARRFLGKKQEDIPQNRGKTRINFDDLASEYKLKGRNYRAQVGKGSPMIGKRLTELNLREAHGANIIAVERRLNRLRNVVLDGVPDRVIQENDVLLFDFFYPEKVDFFLQQFNLVSLPLMSSYFNEHSREIGMVEVAIHPDSKLIDKTVLENTFRSKFGLNVMGIKRQGEVLENELLNEKLKRGDILLVFGMWRAIRQLQTMKNDFVVLTIPAEVDEVAPAMDRAPYAIIALLVTIGLMISGIFPNVLIAIFGALLMGAFGCITMDSAYKSIHWQSIILIVGMFPFAVALQNTGGVDLAVKYLLEASGDASPRVILAMLFGFTAVIGLFISNTATAVLLAPIAIQTATVLEVSPYPFAMAVAIAASAAFMTPVSSPVNTLVVAPGKYSFADFIKIGVPFVIIVMLIAVTFIPLLFPL